MVDLTEGKKLNMKIELYQMNIQGEDKKFQGGETTNILIYKNS